jgi:hypothetical protein
LRARVAKARSEGETGGPHDVRRRCLSVGTEPEPAPAQRRDEVEPSLGERPETRCRNIHEARPLGAEVEDRSKVRVRLRVEDHEWMDDRPTDDSRALESLS